MRVVALFCVMKEKYLDHNGKEITVSERTNVAIANKVYDAIRKYCNKKGLKIGKFFEQAATEKMNNVAK